jgi:hypothetical protein
LTRATQVNGLPVNRGLFVEFFHTSERDMVCRAGRGVNHRGIAETQYSRARKS